MQPVLHLLLCVHVGGVGEGGGVWVAQVVHVDMGGVGCKWAGGLCHGRTGERSGRVIVRLSCCPVTKITFVRWKSSLPPSQFFVLLCPVIKLPSQAPASVALGGRDCPSSPATEHWHDSPNVWQYRTICLATCTCRPSHFQSM